MGEIVPQDTAIDLFELADLGHLDTFVHLMHRLAHQPKLYHLD